jgi:hypothetical protein
MTAPKSPAPPGALEAIHGARKRSRESAAKRRADATAATAALPPLRLADFECFGPAAQGSADDHLATAIPKIKATLDKHSQENKDSPRCVTRDERCLRFELALLLWKYAREEAGQDGVAPLPSDVRLCLAEVVKAAQALYAALRTLLLKSGQNDDAANDATFVLSTAPGVNLAELFSQLEAVLAVTKRKGSGGRPPGAPWYALMAGAARIFEDVTGEPFKVYYSPDADAYCGNFFTMAVLIDAAAAAAVQRPPTSNKVLGQRLSRVASDRKKLSQPAADA